MDNLLGKRKPEDGDLETERTLKKPKDVTMKGIADTLQQIKRRLDLLESKFDQANFISLNKDTVEGFDEIHDFVEEVVEPKKTLFIANLSDNIRILDIIVFFKNVGEVVRVQLLLDSKNKRVGCGFVEFASANEAKKALQEKNGEYLHDREITLDVANKGDTYRPPKFCIDHKVWFEDYLQRESLPIEEDETPSEFTEKVLIVASLSPQTTKTSEIIYFFKDVAKVVSVQLIVDHEGKHVGYAFVGFASANEAKEAMEKKNGKYLHDHKIFLMKGVDETPDPAEVAAVRSKSLFVSSCPDYFGISDIINFFKDVGKKVVRVRLNVNRKGKYYGSGLVEFASADEANKALKKNGKYLHNDKNKVDVFRPAPCQWIQSPSMSCIDHKIWYEDYLRRESLMIETPDFSEEVAVRNKTLFIANLPPKTKISYIINFFKDVGEVVGVRFIVDHWGKHVGCGFVEFASPDEANKALQEKNRKYLLGYKIFLDMAQIIAPYPFRAKYNFEEKLWYEYVLETEQFLKKPKVKFCGKKITFSDDNDTSSSESSSDDDK